MPLPGALGRRLARPAQGRAMTIAAGLMAGRPFPLARGGSVDGQRCGVHLPLPLAAVQGELRNSAPAPVPSRTKLASFNANLHCSIIGTCLSTAELRSVLVKFKLADVKASDHELHRIGVTAAGGRGIGAKMLNKTLDRKFARHIARFAGAKSEAEVERHWRDGLDAGDIPGAYWATLTHPAATDALVARAFGEIHMLSHLVGAANRADIRRLRALETENEGLLDKVTRQQAALHAVVAPRDAKIRDLERLLVAALDERRDGGAPGVSGGSDAEAMQEMLLGQARRLSRAQERAARLEGRNRELERRLAAVEAANEAAAQECAALREEAAALERALLDREAAMPDERDAPRDLAGATILYVGGRAHQVAHFLRVVEGANGRFLHHSGGSEDNPLLLPGCVSRADLVLFPVDCISHQAMNELKRHCKQADKPYLPMRTASVAGLLVALDAVRPPATATPPSDAVATAGA